MFKELGIFLITPLYYILSANIRIFEKNCKKTILNSNTDNIHSNIIITR